MTEVTWKQELRLVSELLEKWNGFLIQPTHGRATSDTADRFRQQFSPINDTGMLRDHVRQFIERIESGHGSPEDPFQLGGYMIVPEVTAGTPRLFPLVTCVVCVREGELQLTLRVVTFFTDGIMECTDAHGWRFDMSDALADGEPAGPRHHHFPHVQRVISWRPSESNFYPPVQLAPRSTGDNMAGPTLNATRPAFPLPVSSPAGLIIAAMASLYGAEITVGIVENVISKPARLRRDMSTVLSYP